MGFARGASHALEQALVEAHVLARQAMLDKFSMDDRMERAEDRRRGRDIQDENLAQLRATREEAAKRAQTERAKGVAELLSPEAELDPTTEQTLQDGGLSSLIKKTPITTSMRVKEGLNAPTAENPLGLDTPAAPPVTVEGGKSLFGGTAKQIEEKRKRDARAAYIKTLPPGEMRTYLEAQDATGDTSLPAALAVPAKPAPKQVVGSARTGYFELKPDGTKVQIIPPVPDKEPKQPPLQFAYDKDGTVHAFRDGPHGPVEVPLPPGLVTKTAPGKTPAQIEADATARAHGAATGKAAAPTKPGLFGTLGSILNPSSTPASAGGGGKVRARDAQGVLHEAAAGTPLPQGWVLEK